ncbi:hypothetical protein EST38_g11075 [Candolleomyces aberdarensis]|uniref:Retroviral polymerase SH3-like domain-containing protein n=1 Tax=Candolleomyces aberdarensis TaxID=2316362 RepID=A0A4Q2D7C0_9AGAR|nr:hypothetical protein EST38_g11075 [Candolleomyces aberdarensis]
MPRYSAQGLELPAYRSTFWRDPPFEAWFGKKPDLGRFRVFGCTAYVFLQKDKRKTLEPHMQKCIFVGYPPDYHA